MMILEKEEREIINFLWSQEIYDIFYNNKTLIKEIIEKINNKKPLNKSKKINDIKIFNKKVIKLVKKLKLKYYRKKQKIINKNIKNKLIYVEGSNGVGKSIFICILVKLINCERILIYDLKNDVKTIIKSKDTNNKINFISKNFKCEDFFNNKDKYNLIIFENSNYIENDVKKEILKKSDEIILLVEANLLGIKKSKEILEQDINKFNISKNKIKIIFNKIMPFSINDLILNQLFSDFEIIGKLKFNYKYDLIINYNLKTIDNEIKKEYLKIIKKIGG